MSQVATIPQHNGGDIIESVITKGDLSKLSPQERTRYYTEVCRSVGLNALTKPFEYITLNGKLTLYALRTCTDQLRNVHGVSVEDLAESERDGVFIVTAKVRNKDGRTDVAKGAVNINGLKGEALANALMKAETKAKRRATLSICGLGWLDESEVDSVPGARVGAPQEQPAAIAPPKPVEPPHDPETGEVSPHAIAKGGTALEWGGKMIAAIKSATSVEEVRAWLSKNAEALSDLENVAPKVYAKIDKAAHDRNNEVAAAPASDELNDPLPFV